MDSRVPEIKQLRQDIDSILQRVKVIDHENILPTGNVTYKLTEAAMWLGQCLKHIGEDNPYPHSRDAASPIIEPTADGLKY